VTLSEPAAEPVAFTAFEPAEHPDPYPAFRRVREATAACPLLLGDVPVTVFTRYEDCAAILTSPDWGHGYQAGISPFRDTGALIPGSFIRMDPPDHTRYRGLVTKAFSPRTVAALVPMVEEVVDELLDAALVREDVDVLGDLAVPLALRMIGGRVLGVPEADRPALRQWQLDIARGTDPDELLPAAAITARGLAARDAAAYFQQLITRRRAEPAEDLLSTLIRVEERGDTLTEPELVGICLLLLVAGMETSINLIGNGVLALLRHPDQLARLRATDDPDLDRSTVEELMRFDGPIQMVERITLEPVVIGGREIPARRIVVCLTAAANRDPYAFPNPDRLDLGRTPNPHVGFGGGAHFCLGAALARLEGRIAIATLARRFPQLRLLDPKPEWRPSFTIRGLKALPLGL
jgi:cytochrome P450